MGKQTTPLTIRGLEKGSPIVWRDACELYDETPKWKLWDALWVFMDRTDCAGDDAAKVAAIWQQSRKR